MPSPPATKPGVIKDPALAALFINKDPEQRYDDLREVGHGSFGAVYYDRCETVAIKKMSYTGKQASEKWTDILKEVSFLNKIQHKHIVSYKACYLKDHTCWLVMEYCIGSTADIVDVLKKGLRETEIGVICTQTLDALEYLHSLHRIHRDIKAGNILLSDQAVIKLADFGSAALCDPASTFIGTPYFMAPEVIMSMDEGNYNHKADIWSLGITCIELAERRPPLFNMHTMSALYHIAQNDPPVLAPVADGQPEWSADFISFVAQCLEKDPEDRLTATSCMNHPFIRTSRPRDTIQEMVNRTKNMVMELDNFQYRKMRKLLYLEEPEGTAAESKSAQDDDLDDLPNNSDVLSVGRGNDSASSRSASLKSLTSYQSMQSSNGPGGNKRPPIPSSMLHEIKKDENCTLIPVGDSIDSEKGEENHLNSPLPKTERNIREDVQTLRKSKFATLRSAKLISKEQEEYTKENNMYEQLSGYKRLRQQHHKEMQTLEERCAVDMEMLRIRLDKELEQLQSNNGKDRQRIKVAHHSEQDKKRREVDEGEKKLRKQLLSRQQREMQAFSSQQLREYKHNKEIIKSTLKQRGLSRSAYEQAVKEAKADLNRQKQHAESNFDGKLRAEFDLEMIRYRRAQLARTHSLEEKLEEDEMNAQERHMESVQSVLLRHHEATKEMERSQQWEIHALKKKHQEKQHEAETFNQIEYNRRQTDELQKKHAMQSRQQPRELKLKEAQIRKQYRQAVKTQTRQFKLWQTQLLQAAPREEQKEISNRLKDEQKRKIALLASQYESQIENMVQEKTVKLESWQVDEAKNQAEKLSKELEELKAYQARQRQSTDSVILKEKTALGDKINLRHVLLLQKFDEERQDLSRLRDTKRSSLIERHEKERRELDAAADAHTTSL